MLALANTGRDREFEASSGGSDIAGLERRLKLAKAEWELRLKQHSEAVDRPVKGRKARRAAEELARAKADYQLAWQALWDAQDPGRTGTRSEPAGVVSNLEPKAKVSLSNASIEQLREVGMSLTQARRVVRHREMNGGFIDLDDLDALPGFPAGLVARVKELSTR